MYPNLEYVLKKRYVVRIILRGAVLLLFVLGLIPLAYALLQVLLVVPFNNQLYQYYGTSSGWADIMVMSTSEAGKYMLPGLLILVTRRSLEHFIVPFPKSECPRCEYGLEKISGPRCPECGLKLPAELQQNEDDPDA